MESVLALLIPGLLVGLAIILIAMALTGLPAPTETGHQPNRVYIDQSGNLHTNGGVLVMDGASMINVKTSTFSSGSQTPTYLAANLVGAYDTYLILTGAPGGGVTGTFDTTANILAAIPGGWYIGLSYMLRIVNHALGQTVTPTAGDGSTTISGPGVVTIATSTFRDFVVTVGGTVAAPTLTFASVGTGTES